MKKLIAILVLLTSGAFAQLLPANGNAYVASDYGQWRAFIQGGGTGTGAQTYTLSIPNISIKGRSFCPFAVNAPLLLGTGANQETATPSAVANCIVTSGGAVQATITITVNNPHGNDIVQSGTFGLQEALNDAAGFNPSFASGGGFVVADNLWGNLGGTEAMIAAATPFSNVQIEDKRLVAGNGWRPYAARPTNSTPLAAGSAPTVNAASGGSMTSGTHRVKYEYMDINGQLGQPSTETADGNSRTGLSIVAPAASPGAVGWIPCVTANGGATKTEKCFMGAALTGICTLSRWTPIPSCAVTNTAYAQTGSNATILADVASTAPFVFGNSNLTFANDTGYQGSSTAIAYVPVPASTAFLPFSPRILGAATAAASNSTYEVGMWNLPAGFLNILGSKWNLCINGHATSAANSETLTVNFRFGPYQNSDTVLNALVTSAYSSTNVVDIKACVQLVPTVLGSSGTIVTDHGLLTTNLAGSAALTQFTEATASNANTGVIASLPLSTNQQLTVENVIGTGAFGSAITWDSLSLEPVN